MKLSIIGLLIFLSCNAPKEIIDTKNLAITLTKTECGSYEVKNNEVLIGYVVKPFYVEVDKKEDYILQFEKLIKTNYSDYYDRFYRTYWFSKDRGSDTLIIVEMLSAKQLSSVPNWQCEQQDVDIYNQLHKNRKSSKYPTYFIYNCTKARFKVLGDPD
jgi:hypothetical protein